MRRVTKGDWIIPLFTLLGVVFGASVTGISNVFVEGQKSIGELKLEEKKFEENKRLERQKLDADLVKLALQTSGVNGADTLGFMVQTHLIEDLDIRNGVSAYLDSKKAVPRLQTELRLSEEYVQAVSPDGRIQATAFRSRTVRLTNPAWKGVDALEKEIEADRITGLSFSPDSGKLIVVGTSYSGTNNSVTVFDMETGQRIGFIKLKGEPPYGVRFSNDGKRILVGTVTQEPFAYDEHGNEVEIREGDR